MLKVILDADGYSVGTLYVAENVLTVLLCTTLPTDPIPVAVGVYALIPPADLGICTTDKRLPNMINPDETTEEKPDA